MEKFREIIALSLPQQLFLTVVVTLFVVCLVKLIKSAINDWKSAGFKGIIDELIKGGIAIGIIIALFFNIDVLVTFFEIIGLVFKVALEGLKSIAELIIGN